MQAFETYTHGKAMRRKNTVTIRLPRSESCLGWGHKHILGPLFIQLFSSCGNYIGD